MKCYYGFIGRWQFDAVFKVRWHLGFQFFFWGCWFWLGPVGFGCVRTRHA